MATKRSAAPEIVSIAWWNRPIVWGVALLAICVLGLGMLGSAFSGPEISTAAPLTDTNQYDVEATAPLPEPAPAPEPAHVESGDYGVSVHGDHNTVTVNPALPQAPSDSLTIVQRRIERHLVIVEQPVIEERVVYIERERRPAPVESAPQYADCGPLHAEYYRKVAEIKRRLFD